MDNFLTWMYFSDIVYDVGFVFFVFLVILLFRLLVMITVERKGLKDACLKKVLIAFFLLSIINILLPSQRTMLTIAATKAGQQALNTDVAKKAMLVLDKKLDHMLKDSIDIDAPECTDETRKKIRVE